MLFRVSISLKGIDGVLEVASGAALAVLGPGWVRNAAIFLSENELSRHPRDAIAKLFFESAQHFSVGTAHFATAYLLTHGAVKIVLVAALLRDLRWAYPVAIIIFAAFVCYQIYRFTYTHALSLIALSLFDLIVIALVWLEYRAHKDVRTNRAVGGSG